MPVINLVLLCSKCTLPCPALILSACATVRPCRGRYENTEGASLPGSRAFLLAPAAQLPVGSFPVRSGHDQNTDSSSLTPARSTSVTVSAILRSISMWTNPVPSLRHPGWKADHFRGFSVSSREVVDAAFMYYSCIL